MNSKPADHLRFLVDVNLPKKFQFFNSNHFIHVVDINPVMKDKEIWDYAILNELVILTKDTDFYEMFLVNDIYPKVVFLKFGNLKISDLHLFFQKFWPSIVDRLENSSFIIANLTTITVIK